MREREREKQTGRKRKKEEKEKIEDKQPFIRWIRQVSMRKMKFNIEFLFALTKNSRSSVYLSLFTIE